jgi:hypothetical protein
MPGSAIRDSDQRFGIEDGDEGYGMSDKGFGIRPSVGATAVEGEERLDNFLPEG